MPVLCLFEPLFPHLSSDRLRKIVSKIHQNCLRFRQASFNQRLPNKFSRVTSELQLLRFVLILCVVALAGGCSPRGYDFSSGFTKDSAYSLFTSSVLKEPIYIICVQTPPHQPRSTFGTDIYGSGYFHLDDGRKIQFSMPDSRTVMVDKQAVKLADGRLIRVVVESGSTRIEQESLDTALAREILSH